MPLFGSTPSKPAALISLNFSRTDWSPRIVPYMMAFFLPPDAAGAGTLSSATNPTGCNAAAASTPPPSFKKSRRFNDVFMCQVVSAFLFLAFVFDSQFETRQSKLNELRLARHRHGRNGERGIPRQVRWHECFLGIQRLLPGDLL